MKDAVYWDVALRRTDVSEDRIASIFREEESASAGPGLKS
jgi:hypothetical protein